MDAVLWIPRKFDRQMLLMCCCRDSWWIPRCFSDGLNWILFLPVFANSLPTKLRCDVELTSYRHDLSLICVKLELINVHPAEQIIRACLGASLGCEKLHGRSFFGRFRVISIFMVITTMGTDNSEQWMSTQSGPSTEPCKTPNSNGQGEDTMLSTITDCSQLHK